MTNYEKYLVTRPLFARFDYENDIPVIRKQNIKQESLEKGSPLNFSNLAKFKSNSIILTFHHDKRLNALWNNPLNYVRKFKNCLAVLTPDFTVQPGMDIELIRMNIYKNRWLGCTWQQYGVDVIPTISWAGPETYDICFSGITPKSIVAISTIGCQKDNEKKAFLDGYNELLRRKEPSLILVYGSLIDGMKGRILPIEYREGFGLEEKYEQVSLFDLSRILDVKEGDYYGW